MIGQFFDYLLSGVFDFVGGIIGILPKFPMDDIQDALNAVGAVETVLSWVNWFLPIDIASTIIAIWTTSMMAYITIKLGFKYANIVRF